MSFQDIFQEFQLETVECNLKKRTIQIVEVQPATELENKKCLITINTIRIKAIMENTRPKSVDRESGTEENATIDSIEYLNNCQNDQLVSPVTLSMFSYSNHFVLKPTH